MTVAAQTLDAGGVPLSSGYKPDSNNTYLIQLSQRTKIDIVGNTYAPPVFETVNQEYVRLGIMYIATTTLLVTATNPNLTQGASLFNPAGSGKTLLVLSAKCSQSAGSANLMQLAWTTTDPQLGAPTALSPRNFSMGGTASALAGLTPIPVTSSANNAAASISTSSTLLDSVYKASPEPYEFIPNNAGILLPAGVANGLLVTTLVATPATTTYVITFRYVEY